jgi:hypothetical protein
MTRAGVVGNATYLLATGACSGCAVALVLYSLAWHARYRSLYTKRATSKGDPLDAK